MALKKTPAKKSAPKKSAVKKSAVETAPKKTPRKRTPRKKTREDGAVAAIQAVLRALDQVERDVGRLEACAREDVAQAS